MIKKLKRPFIRFVIAIACFLALGGLFRLYTTEVMSETQQQEVLVKGIPFVAVFIAILLVFIFVIVAAALLLKGKVPPRTYRPVESVIIAGIVIGVVGLFQGWTLFGYEYGFLLLLISLLLFMIWSHITPQTARSGVHAPPLTRRAHTIGIVAGVIVWVLIVILVNRANQPVEPYGLSPALWNMKNDEERAAIVDDAEDQHRQVTIPLIVLGSLLPGAIAYFAGREIAAQAGAPRTGAIQPADGVRLGG
jgi:lysylphosphatidylglycerol synthetase-like protein (DUF2156 family)